MRAAAAAAKCTAKSAAAWKARISATAIKAESAVYLPAKFRQNDWQRVCAFLAAHPLAVLCGHFAKANPLVRTLMPEQDWLAVFQSGGCYVSPDGYPGKQRDRKAVPAWNDQAVQIRGRLKIAETADSDGLY